jgi:hypothetical protein
MARLWRDKVVILGLGVDSKVESMVDEAGSFQAHRVLLDPKFT